MGLVCCLHGFRLGRQCDRPKEHFWMLFQFGLDKSVVVHSEAKVVALNSAEPEYMAASQAICEALWLHNLLVDLFD